MEKKHDVLIIVFSESCRRLATPAPRISVSVVISSSFVPFGEYRSFCIVKCENLFPAIVHVGTHAYYRTPFMELDSCHDDETLEVGVLNAGILTNMGILEKIMAPCHLLSETPFPEERILLFGRAPSLEKTPSSVLLPPTHQCC